MSSDIEHEPWRTVEYGNLALVRAVKKRPCLYNNTLPEYSQKDLTRAAWDEIAEEFGCSVDDCKKRWKAIRVVYRRDITSKKKRKPYYLAKHMEFMRPYLTFDPIPTYRSLVKALNEKVSGLSSSVNNSEILEAVKDIEFSDEAIKINDFSSIANNMETTSNNSEDIPVEIANAIIALQNQDSNVNASDLASKGSVQPVIIQCMKTDEDYADTNYSQINTENPRRQFISSLLLPEVEDMTEKQFRNFKRRVLQVIDDVLFDS